MRKPFAVMTRASAPESLRTAVHARIARSRRNAFVFGMATSVAVEVASAVAVVASFSYVSRALESSGVYDYASLILSEGTGILGYSRELGLTLLESMPVLAVATVLAALLALGLSTVRLVRQSRSVAVYA